MRTNAGVNPLYADAARATAAGSKSFYFATHFFPREMARSAHAVYWFCRHTDDLVDEAVSTEEGRRNLESWALQLDRVLEGGKSEHPILELFREAMNRHGIPHQYPRLLIEGMRMDLERVRYQDFAALRVFCYRVASVVGLMMSHVIGFRDDALEYATDLGIAMQLTNILRDIGEDLRRGRIYLPVEEMSAFGYTETDLMERRRDERFRQMMAFQVRRAHTYYDKAMPGIALLNEDGRFAVQVAADIYRCILNQIERSDYDVFDKRAVVPAVSKYWLTARSLIGPACRLLR